MKTLKGENLEMVNDVLEEREHPAFCPCIRCWTERERENETNRDQEQMSHEDYVDQVIMGNNDEE